LIDAAVSSGEPALTEADQPRGLIACLVFATVGFLTSMGMPLMVSALIAEYHYSEGQAGYVASAEYCGMLLAAVVVSSLILRVSRRRLALTAIAIAVSANLASLLVHELPAVISIRLLSGLGCGMAYAVSVAILAGTVNIVRNFMFLQFANSITNVVVLYTFPPVMARFGLAGMLASYTVLLLLTALAIRTLPERRAAQSSHPVRAARDIPHRPTLWVCLFAVFSFYLMIGAYWAYLVPLGQAIGYDAAFVSHLLSWGILLSLVSCLTAYRLSKRLGQSRPLLFALGAIAVTFWVSAAWFGPPMFIAGLVLVNFFWNFTDIYQFGTIARIDPSGVFASRIQGAQMLGYVVSPAMAGWLLDHHLGYARLLALFGSYVAAAFISYSAVYLATRRPLALTAPSVASEAARELE
jgi:MFS transporter, DHA1 family, inner membrane transport protein